MSKNQLTIVATIMTALSLVAGHAFRAPANESVLAGGTSARAVSPMELASLVQGGGGPGPLDTQAGMLAAFAAKQGQVNDAEAGYWDGIATAISIGELPLVFQDLMDEYDDAVLEADDILAFRLQLLTELGNGIYAPTINPADFSPNITNTYFPLPVGRVRIYEKMTPDGLERIEVGATPETIDINGVLCRVVTDLVTIGGVLHEDTVDWYTQKSDGSVWYFGEIAKNFDDDGLLDNLDGSWRYGKDDAQPGILMQANPVVGGAYRQEVAVNVAEDMARVIMTGVTVTVPAGTFTNCIVTEDFTPLDPTVREHKYYAPNVGVVLELDPDTGEMLELVAILD